VKKQLTSLDLFYLVKELQDLAGARVQKIYQDGDSVYLVVYGGQVKQTLVLAPNRITVTEYEHEFPKQPAGFCMLLRKHLINKRIISIKQHEFERIVEIEFADRFLIVELFSDGNVILTDKNTGEIIKPLHTQRWKDREVLSRHPYQYPPAGGINTSVLKKEDAIKILKESEKDLVRTLATKFSLGGNYAEEVLYRADVYGDNMGSELNDKTLEKIYNHTKELFEQVPAPQLYAKKGLVTPFILKKEEEQPKSYATLSQSADEFFKETVVIRDKHDNLEHRLLEQKETLKKLGKDETKYKKEGDDLSQEQKFKEANAAYQKSKKAKKKETGLKEAITKTEKDLKKAQVVVKEPKKKEIVKQEWYEKFRWFKTSDDYLVIGGKDATSNDIVVKKHAGKLDIVFHAQIIGAPFCVIKVEKKKKVPETTIEEAAQFAASYSKAWQQGLGTVDVFWVYPDQLKKEVGLKAGAFMVHGKHNYLHSVVLELAFGLDKDRKLIHGPVKMVEKITKQFVRVQPGRVKAGELAKKIKHKLRYEGNVNDIQRFIPAGKGRLK
jgi:predicted ribosome quality control (RQC) complex YloA/Tae2 family protein